MAIIAVAAVAAVAAAAGTYMQMQAQADSQRAQAKMAKYAAEQERQAGEARRKMVKARAESLLESQASKAAASGVQAYESASLLENQLEAAGLAAYEADLAAYPHELASARESYTSRLLKRAARQTEESAIYSSLIAGAQAGTSAYVGGGGMKSGGGKSISTGYDSASLNSQGWGYM
jgi:hypothetical protein